MMKKKKKSSRKKKLLAVDARSLVGILGETMPP